MEDIKIISTVGGVEELVNPLPTNLCVNCCQPLYNILDDVKFNPFYNKILESLSSLYRLNYLSTLLDEEVSIWSGNSDSVRVEAKLCDNCLQVFESLYKLYDDFNQLRSIESLLANEIMKLDECIKAHQDCRAINQNSILQSNDNILEPVQRKKKVHASRNIKKQKKKSDLQKSSAKAKKRRIKTTKEIPTTTTVSISESGPLVLVRRLEDDPIAQAALSKTQNIRVKQEVTRTSSFQPDVEEASMDHDSLPPSPALEEVNDSDFVPLEEGDDVVDDDMNGTDDEDWEAPQTIKSTKRSPVKSVKTNNKTIKNKSKIDDDKDTQIKELFPKRKKMSVSQENAYLEFAYRRRKLTSPNPCWHCELDFETPAECFQHAKSVHFQPGNFICKSCARVIPKKVSYTRHVKKCETLKPGELLTDHPCEKCGKIFPLAHQLKAHLRKHLKPDHLTCSFPGCDFQTKYTTSLKSHIIYQHEKPEEEAICDICGRIFKAHYLLKAHYFRLHSEEHVEKYREWLKGLLERKKAKRRMKAGERPTFCDICNVDMITRNGYLHHKRTFHGEVEMTDVVCELCGKGFTQGKLKRHIETVHCETRNHVCSQCPKTFKTASMLGDHFRRTHTEEGRLKYNAKVRAQNQRRKMRQNALARTVLSVTGTSTITNVNPNDPANDSIPQSSATLVSVINPQPILNNANIDHYGSTCSSNDSSNIFIMQSHD